MVESIEGPFKGYYVAAYAHAIEERPGAYVAYAKVCRSRPDSYWEAYDCLLKDSSGMLKPSPAEAVALALDLAKLQIRKLPDVDHLPPQFARRAIQTHERAALGLLW
jgi:hypothetical protein